MFIEGQEHVCPAGSFIYVPAGVPHGFRVGPMTSRKLNIFVPAAMVGYFDELSARDRPRRDGRRHARRHRAPPRDGGHRPGPRGLRLSRYIDTGASASPPNANVCPRQRHDWSAEFSLVGSATLPSSKRCYQTLSFVAVTTGFSTTPVGLATGR